MGDWAGTQQRHSKRIVTPKGEHVMPDWLLYAIAGHVIECLIPLAILACAFAFWPVAGWFADRQRNARREHNDTGA